MKFGLLLELQLPRPWTDGAEQQLFDEGLEQTVLAEELGLDYVWEVEHHFLEEYAHSSAPEVFLAAAAARTSRIRLGTGITLMPPAFNHPARVAERIATLDLVSHGRIDFGTGEGASRIELEGYGVPLEEKRPMWLECTEQVANMLAMDPYPGFQGRYFSMPARNIVPKPVQRPHPPMWMACSNRDAIRTAARLGLGALTFVLVDPSAAKDWISEYYEIIKSECVPIGHSVNAQVCLTTPLSLDRDEERARDLGLDGRLFFQRAMAHYYVDGVHKPGRTNLWEGFLGVRDVLEQNMPRGTPSCIGTPEQARELVRGYRDAGAAQVMFFVQMGKTSHEHSCNSMRLFAQEVMPEFRDEIAERKRQHELAPYIAAAMKRKQKMQPLADDEIPEFAAYKRAVAKEGEQIAGALREDSWEEGLRQTMARLGLLREQSKQEE